jgi:ABC-2 type transport system permease protein
MKKLTSLSLIELDQHYKISKNKYLLKHTKDETIPFFALIAVLATLIIIYFPFYLDFIRVNLEYYSLKNIEPLFIAEFIMITGFIGFFLGAFVLIGEFFLKKDMKLLITLPLKPSEVILGKLSVVLCDQMIISLIFLLPALIYYGIYNHLSFGYYLSTALVVLFSQIFPVLLVLVFILPISHLFKKIKNKELILYILTSLFMILALIYIFSSKDIFFIVAKNPQDMPDIYINPQGIFSRLTWVYPPAFFGAKSLINTGIYRLTWTIGFIGFHIILLLLSLFIGEKLYYSTYVNFLEASTSAEKEKAENIDLLFNKALSPNRALLKREWLYFLKTPSFSVNGFTNVLIFPGLCILLAIVDAGIGINLQRELVSPLLEIKMFLVVFISAIAGSLSGLSYSCFSREGKFIKELKVLPISSSQILRSKFFHIMQLSSIGIISGALIGYILFNLNFLEFINALIFSIIISIFFNLLQMLIDAFKPSFDWDNPQKAMKQNANGLFSILVIFGILILLGFLYYFFSIYFDLHFVLIISSCIFVIFDILLYKLLKNRTTKLLKED